MTRTQASPLVQAMSRLGAIGALIYFLFSGIGPSVRFGKSIGETFIHALAVGPFESSLFEGLLTALGVLLVGLAIMMLFVLFGALLGSAIGAALAPYLRMSANGDTPREDES